MKHVRLFPLLAALLFAFACTDDPSEGVRSSPDPASDPSDHRVPVATALADLESVLARLDEPATRGGSARRVGAIATVKAEDLLPATRSGEKPALEELVYLANFEGGEGYALLGADDRMPSIIAITDQGNLPPDELAAAVGSVPAFSADNPPSVIPEVAAYLGATASGGIIGGIDGPPVDPPVFTSYVVYDEWGESMRISSMIRVKWAQGPPYNRYCPAAPGGKPDPVGCVAVALGQIAAMNVYDGKYPASRIAGVCPFEWSTIIAAIDMLAGRAGRTFEKKDYESPEAKAVASLLRTIGGLIEMNYTPDGSGAPSKNAAAFMTNYLGYKNVSLAPYSETVIYNTLRKNLPVYIEGWYRPQGYQKRDGHTWVIDGWSRQQRAVRTYSFKTDALLSTTYEYRELFHCNYGWEGLCDGYYFPGIFTLFTGAGPEYTDKFVDDRGETTDEVYNLNSDLKIITYSSFF